MGIPNNWPVIGILALLGLFIIYAFRLLVKDKKRENYLFLSYLLLIFVIIYSVSILNYKIGGPNLSVEQIKEEINKRVLLKLADSYIYSATETGRFPPGALDLQKTMIEKRNTAEKLYKDAGLEEKEIQLKTLKINNLITTDIIRDIKKDAIEESRKTNPDNFKALNNEFENIAQNDHFDESTMTKVNTILNNYNISNEKIKNNIGELKHFLENKTLKP